MQTYRIVPEEWAQPGAREYIRGGTKEENARITEAVLSGGPGPRRDVVLLNAAAALAGRRPGAHAA